MSSTPRIEQIKASAGSGKTYALTQRFLSLLSGATRGSGSDAALRACGTRGAEYTQKEYTWTDILAATFTNKAAGEMRGRVIERLKRHALELEGNPEPGWTPEKAAQWVDVLLRRYASLNIRTIDSLLLNLVKLCALDLGLPPDFEPGFDWSDYFDPLYEEALDGFTPKGAGGGLEMEHERNAQLYGLLQQAFSELVRHADVKGFAPGEGFHDDLANLFDLALLEGPLPVHPTRELAARRTQLIDGAAQSATALLSLLESEKLAVNAIFIKHLRECPGLNPHAALPQRAWPYKECLDDCLNKASKGKASGMAEAAFFAYQADWQRAERESILYTQAIRLAPLAGLANTLAERLPEFQRRTGIVPHVLTPLLAGRILAGGAATEAFCRLGVRIAHILVDEFQDTSRAQWAAIAPLAEECLSTGGSLTVVGDMKQAIYRWRGGDAALFDEVPVDPALTSMLHTGVELTKLAFNRRSCPAVVEHNNQVFGVLESPEAALDVVLAMLPAEPPQYVDRIDISRAAGGVAAALAAAFGGSAQDIPESAAEMGAGYVKLSRVTAERSEELLDAVHERLRTLFMDNLAPRRAWRDVAVLVFSNKEAALLAGWLMDWGVPVITDQSLRLAAHPLVRQLTAYLTCMNNPADDVAFWALLSAGADGRDSLLGAELAAVGLSWPDILQWRMDTAERGTAIKGMLATRFREDFPQAWERLFAPFHNRAGLLGPYDAAAELLARFDVQQRFDEAGAYMRRFLEVVHSAESKGMASLAAFLEHWAAHGDAERVPMPESLDAVRILTMHKAKGLQFPVVVIPFHHQWMGGLAPMRMDVGGLELIARPHAAQGEPYYQAYAENAVERLYVLYVAWTRAMEELHGFLTSSRSFAQTPLVKGINALLCAAGIDVADEYEYGRQGDVPTMPNGPEMAEALDSKFIAGPVTPMFAPTAEQGAALAAPAFPDGTDAMGDAPALCAGANWQPMHWLPRLKIYRNPLRQFQKAEQAHITEAQRGLFVHDCLERLVAMRGGAQPFMGGAAAGIAQAVEMSSAVFPLAIPPALSAEAVDMLTWLTNLPEADAWFAHGIAEQTIMDEEGSLHRADLLVYEADLCTVVEYKTGAKSSAHVEQTRRYLGLLARMNVAKRYQGRIVYLDGRDVEAVELAS